MKINKEDFKKLISECINEVINEEANLAVSELDAIFTYAKQLKEMVSDQTELEDWQKSKITLAKAYLESVFSSLHHSVDTDGDMDADDSGELPQPDSKESNDLGDIETDSFSDIKETNKCNTGCKCEKCSKVKEGNDKVKKYIQATPSSSSSGNKSEKKKISKIFKKS
jgi:hypothetical protein